MDVLPYVGHDEACGFQYQSSLFMNITLLNIITC